jgi:protein gp37
MAESAIEWTDETWNPVTGCDRVSPGCAHCYALTLAKRLKAMGNPRYQVDGGPASGPGFGVTLHRTSSRSRCAGAGRGWCSSTR